MPMLYKEVGLVMWCVFGGLLENVPPAVGIGPQVEIGERVICDAVGSG